jgi:IS30 family transposase
MGQKYRQLTLEKRERLYELSQQNFQKDDMAILLGCHRSTIYRELCRNKTRIGYLPDRAHKMALDRCNKSLKIERDHILKNDIVSKLQLGWSPEIICGYLKKERGISVISHETIYAYIYSKESYENKLYLAHSRLKCDKTHTT